MRLIQQLADTIARIAGLNRASQHDLALTQIYKAWDKLLDAPRGLIDAVDTATLAQMLREPARMRIAAQLFYEEGRALAGKALPVRAELRYRRALALMLEARAADPAGLSAQDDAALLELSRLASAGTPDPRDRSN